MSSDTNMPYGREGQAYWGEGPCQKHSCPMFERCAAERMACKAFLRFVHSGRVIEPTEPSREIYSAIFSDAEDREQAA